MMLRSPASTSNHDPGRFRVVDARLARAGSCMKRRIIWSSLLWINLSAMSRSSRRIARLIDGPPSPLCPEAGTHSALSQCSTGNFPQAQAAPARLPAGGACSSVSPRALTPASSVTVGCEPNRCLPTRAACSCSRASGRGVEAELSGSLPSPTCSSLKQRGSTDLPPIRAMPSACGLCVIRRLRQLLGEPSLRLPSWVKSSLRRMRLRDGDGAAVGASRLEDRRQTLATTDSGARVRGIEA